MSIWANMFWILASVCFLAGTVSRAVGWWRRKEEHTLSLLQLLGIGVVGAIWLLLIPVYYHLPAELGDRMHLSWMLPVLASLHHTMRCFILDGDFSFIQEYISRIFGSEILKTLVCAYAGVLFLTAPLLTFGLILSLFRNTYQRVRLACARGALFVFSELNEGSLALAKDIAKQQPKGGFHLVFTDVYEQSDEPSQELVAGARALGAILLSEDITQLRVRKAKTRRVEYFLIGGDEAENIRQTAALTALCKGLPEKKIFCFATTPDSEYLLDSLDKGLFRGDLSNRSLEELKELYQEDTYLKLRRIHLPALVAQDTVSRMGAFDLPVAVPGERPVLSFLLVGMGSHGMEMLRTLLWFTQVPDYHVEINVVDDIDLRTGVPGYLSSRLAYEFPEIMKYNHCYEEGNYDYDIQVFGDIDITTDALRRALQEGPYARRLARTRQVLVMTGEDHRNLTAAVYLRGLFDRIVPPRVTKEGVWQEAVRIGAIVYDTQNLMLLGNGTIPQEGLGLCCYDGAPYHIDIYGDQERIYQYRQIYDEAMEHRAMNQHTGWSSLQAAADAAGEELRRQLCQAIQNKQKYANAEYYRRSSFASARYWQEVREGALSGVYAYGADHQPQAEANCPCGACRKRQVAEHVRWNAYMRSHGYEGHASRINRARCHPALVAQKDLSRAEVLKDVRM